MHNDRENVTSTHQETHDEGHLREVLRRALGGGPLPGMALSYAPEVKYLNQAQRQERELHIAHRAWQALFPEGVPDIDEIEVGWLRCGQPMLAPCRAPGLGLCMSQDREYYLAIVGHGPQGVDIEPIVSRAPVTWRALLGPGLYEQALGVNSAGESFESAGTRLWCAREASGQVFDTPVLAVAVQARQDDVVTLEVQHENGRCLVLTVPVQLSLAPRRMLALVLQASHERVVPESCLTPAEFSEELGVR